MGADRKNKGLSGNSPFVLRPPRASDNGVLSENRESARGAAEKTDEVAEGLLAPPFGKGFFGALGKSEIQHLPEIQTDPVVLAGLEQFSGPDQPQLIVFFASENVLPALAASQAKQRCLSVIFAGKPGQRARALVIRVSGRLKHPDIDRQLLEDGQRPGGSALL